LIRPLSPHRGKHVLSAADVDRLDSAHANICKAWDELRCKLSLATLEQLATQARPIHQGLDVILDIIRDARGVASYADLDHPDDIPDIDAFLDEHTPRREAPGVPS
jgi:hypothetical protein